MRKESCVALLVFSALLSGCGQRDVTIEVDPPDAVVKLNGKIVEGHGSYRLPLVSAQGPIRLEHRLDIAKQGFQGRELHIEWESFTPQNLDSDVEDRAGHGPWLGGFCCGGGCMFLWEHTLGYPLGMLTDTGWHVGDKAGGFWLKDGFKITLLREEAAQPFPKTSP